MADANTRPDIFADLAVLDGSITRLGAALTEARASALEERHRADDLADECAVLRLALCRADDAALVKAERDIAQRRGDRQDRTPGARAGEIRQKWCSRHGNLSHRWIEGAWRCAVCGEAAS